MHASNIAKSIMLQLMKRLCTVQYSVCFKCPGQTLWAFIMFISELLRGLAEQTTHHPGLTYTSMQRSQIMR